MLQQVLALNVFHFMLVLVRMGTAFFMMPGFSAAYVPVPVRLVLALAIAVLVAPALAGTLPPIPATLAGLALLIAGEFFLGAFLGTITRVLLGALQTAGTLISYFSSMANAFVQDPVAEQQSSTFAGFLSVSAVLMLFVTDMHHVMLRAVIDSYVLFTPGQGFAAGDISDMMARLVADSFALGLRLAAPALVVGLTYYLGIGILGRLMPSLHVFFFGLPIQITVQIFVLSLVFSAVMMVFITHFRDTMAVFVLP